MPATVPPSHADLLEQPNFAHLATVRPDGAPQVSEMWFEWDGDVARFTHTTTRQKFRNFAHEPRVSFSVTDPANPYRFIEVRGVVETIEPDPGAAFYIGLGRRYGMDIAPTDADVRVVITVRATAYVVVDAGMTPSELAARKATTQAD
ncbi:MAG: pyridoxamine 5-phosphate oxidase-related protein FMN-binding [Ilumatobacteraceae bacterium]|nr:pyridoxamine 5-phosphate oxidase-related protein FMN-binding [Ilumatobacteraceae bacterium]